MSLTIGYENAAEWWQSDYEDFDFTETIDSLWNAAKPLYDELHTYVRHRLTTIYGNFSMQLINHKDRKRVLK